MAHANDDSVPSSSRSGNWSLRRPVVPVIPTHETVDTEKIQLEPHRQPSASSAPATTDLKELRDEVSANARLTAELGTLVSHLRSEIHSHFTHQNAKGEQDDANDSVLGQLIQKVSHMEKSIREDMKDMWKANHIQHVMRSGSGEQQTDLTLRRSLGAIQSAIEEIRDKPRQKRSSIRTSTISAYSEGSPRAESQAGEIGRWVSDKATYEIHVDGDSLKLVVTEDGNQSKTDLARQPDGFLIGDIQSGNIRLQFVSATSELLINYMVHAAWGADVYASKVVAQEVRGNCLGLEAQRLKMTKHIDTMVNWRERAHLRNYIKHKHDKYLGVYAENESESWWSDVFDDVAHHSASHAEKINRHKRASKNQTTFHKVCIKKIALEQFVQGRCFTTFSVMCILANAVWIAFASNYAMKQLSDQKEPCREKWFDHVDRTFTCIFLVELFIRLVAFRLKFFINSDWLFNWFDFVIVTFSVMDVLSIDSSVAVNANMLRVIRLVRMLRMLRAIKALTFFAELQHYMITLVTSFKVWLWAMFFFLFCTFCTALTVMEFYQSLADHTDSLTLHVIRKHYSSLLQAMFTIIYASTGGVKWGTLIEEQGKTLLSVKVVIFLYVIMMLFMLFPIILAEYSLKVFHVRESDTNVMMQTRMEEADIFLTEFILRCKKAGYKMDRQLTLKELDAFMKHDDIESFLISNDIFLIAEEVFPIFDHDGSAAITVKQFIYGCQWLKTLSKPTDTLFLSEQIQKIQEDLNCQKDKIKHMDRCVADNHYDMKKLIQGELDDEDF